MTCLRRPRDSTCVLLSRFTSTWSKTYEIVDDPSTDSIISWSENGTSFIVWKPGEFSKHLLPIIFPIYFMHHGFSFFTRTLYRFGFKKVECERLEFADDEFVRGEPKRVQNIYKRLEESAEIAHTHRIMLRKKSMKRKKKMDKKVAKEAADLLEGLHI